jgi:hypothetical protein
LTPRSLLAMMRPLFPLPIPGGSPRGFTSSPPDTEAGTSSDTLLLLMPPPALPAPPHSSPRSVSVISIARDEGKVSILCALHGITSETHLFMFDGMACAVPWRISPPRTVGDSPLLLSLIDINRKELQRRGEGEYTVCSCVVEPNTHI